jgi:hypothetical protein
MTLSEEGCVRCGGKLEAIADGHELLPRRGGERRYSIPNPVTEPALDAAR